MSHRTQWTGQRGLLAVAALAALVLVAIATRAPRVAAAVTGLIAFFVQCGLPRLYHPMFGVDGFEQASQDAFLLALAPNDGEVRNVRAWLRKTGAVAIWEMTP